MNTGVRFKHDSIISHSSTTQNKTPGQNASLHFSSFPLLPCSSPAFPLLLFISLSLSGQICLPVCRDAVQVALGDGNFNDHVLQLCSYVLLSGE